MSTGLIEVLEGPEARPREVTQVDGYFRPGYFPPGYFIRGYFPDGAVVVFDPAAKPTFWLRDPGRTFALEDAGRTFQANDPGRTFAPKAPGRTFALPDPGRTFRRAQMVPVATQKRPTWVRKYNWDFSDFEEVKAGATLSAPVISSDPVGLVIGTASVSGALVQCQLSGGTAGVDYTVTARVTLSDGSTLDLPGLLEVET